MTGHRVMVARDDTWRDDGMAPVSLTNTRANDYNGREKSGPGAAVTARVPANDVEVADMPNGTAAVNPPHNPGVR